MQFIKTYNLLTKQIRILAKKPRHRRHDAKIAIIANMAAKGNVNVNTKHALRTNKNITYLLFVKI